MPISVVFDPPLPSDNPSTFNTKAFTLLGDLNDWSTQANALPGEVATNLSALLAAPPAIGSTTPAAGSFTTLSASSTTTGQHTINTGSAANVSTVYTNAGSTRWTAYLGGAGLDYRLSNYNDSGVQVGDALTISRSTGAVTIPGTLTNTSGILLNGSVTLTPGAGQGSIFHSSNYLQITGGSVGIALNNHANTVSNLLITDAGAVTIPGSVTVGTLSASNGLTITKNGPTARALTIKNDSLNINEYVEIHFQNSGTDVIQSSIRSVRDTSGSFGTSLQFLTENDFTSGEAVRMTLSGTGAVTIPGSLSLTGDTFGYGVGAGGTVIQATSKSTAVTLNKPSGQITMNNAALAAGASVQLQLNNTFIANTDIVLVSTSGGTADASYYNVLAWTGSGSALIVVRNMHSASLSDALVLNFAVVKGIAS